MERNLMTPGIAGIVSFAQREPLENQLSRMLEPLRIPADRACTERTWVGSVCGLGVVDPDAQGRLIEQENIILVLSGHVVEDETLAGRLQTVPLDTAQMAMPGCLLALYQHLGASALQGLNGAYVIAIWDALAQRLTLVGDRGGLQPLYYWQHGGAFAFASRIRAIAALPGFASPINPVSVFDLLATEQMLDERTLYSDVQAMPPAGLLTFTQEQLSLQSYWEPALHQPGSLSPSLDEAVEGLADGICTAVNRLVDGIASPAAEQADPASALCLLLTGGLDSRTLAAALARRSVHIPVSANTIGHEQARDVRYGREIARAAGLPYTVLPANPRYLADYSVECVRRTEGGFNVHAAWILGEVDYLTRSGIPAVMDGVGAEAISGRHWLSDQPVTTRAEAVERLCQARWTFSRAAGLLRPELRGPAEAASRETVRRTLDEAPSDHLLGWADYFAYRQSRRHPTGSILADNVRVFEPFFDNQLADYAYALPPDLRSHGDLYKKMIVRRFPEVGGIGYTDSGTRLVDEVQGSAARAHASAGLQDFSRRVYRRLGRRFPVLRRGPFGDNPASAMYYNHWLRTASRDYVTGLLKRTELYGDFLDVGRVRDLLDEHMAGRQDDFRLICGVVTFALWREMFG